ncbi:MAG: GNAT family N-acetyltransferase [Bacteroidia bacterium]|nr:GNAT family N-acetyltransferase [Bacteroidia bacterium]
MNLIQRKHHHKIIGLLEQVPFNNLFALAVLKGYVDGWVYVDNEHAPNAAYIQHPYGMSLLAGYTDNQNFHKWLEQKMMNRDALRVKTEWLQVFPEKWNQVISDLPGIKMIPSSEAEKTNLTTFVELQTRVNFRFSRKKYDNIDRPLLPPGFNIEAVNAATFDSFEGIVVPKGFWNNSEEFLKGGAGFCVMEGDRAVATAFSAFLLDGFLELGIETRASHRGRGMAWHCCASLIDYSLRNGLEPVWACRLENTASMHLAQKLGFEPTFRLPYYKLVV